jgi:hypothetical protein
LANDFADVWSEMSDIRVIGVYENEPLPEGMKVLQLLQVEQHPWGTGTASRRYYVLLVDALLAIEDKEAAA